ncbi:MAG: LytTR family transcriptional regulator DNA-binding domain-containing protein [Ignavibacteria bacterium]|jgi:two-component system LytT family response regulator
MNNIRAIIIDDEKLARDIIKNFLKAHENIELIAESGNGFDGIEKINELKPDIVFLDIQMPKLSGFEMLELIDDPPLIIFTTAFDQYAIKAFEVNATDYLLKPFSKERFNDAVNKALKNFKNIDSAKNKLNDLIRDTNYSKEFLERVAVKQNNKVTIIPSEEIEYLEAQDDYVMIYSSKGKYLKKKTMKFFEENLNPDEFVRIHRSYIVKIDRIEKIESSQSESNTISLKNRQTLPVSKTGYTRLKEFLT